MCIARRTYDTLKKCALTPPPPPPAKGRTEGPLNTNAGLPPLILTDCKRVETLTLYEEEKKRADKLQAALCSHTRTHTHTALSTFGCKCHAQALSHFLCHCSERIFSFSPPTGEDERRLGGRSQAAISRERERERCVCSGQSSTSAKTPPLKQSALVGGVGPCVF